MKRRLISDALNQLDAAWIEEAADAPVHRAKVLPRLLAAAAALCLAFVAAAMLLPRGSVTVAAYACDGGTDTVITADGIRFHAGKLLPNGELVGHPLLFYLTGDDIRTVRFSCQNEKLRFTDLTETRDEFGLVQNFTVTYGKDEGDYAFLLIDWVPERLIAALRGGDYAAFSALPAELTKDTVVMEITDAKGRTATKSITVTLQEDGSFAAAFGDYTVKESDAFVRRQDAQPIPRELLYGTDGVEVEFLDAGGNATAPDSGWYITSGVQTLRITWQGREPDSVRIFYTPSGTETETETALLLTAVPNSAASVLLLPADALHDETCMGHLHVSLQYGNYAVLSKVYNVIFDPN